MPNLKPLNLKSATKPRHTTVWIFESTNDKIKLAKEESLWILTSDDIISSAMDLYLKKLKKTPKFK